MEKKFICPVCGKEEVTLVSLHSQFRGVRFSCPDCGSDSRCFITYNHAVTLNSHWANPVPEPKPMPKDCPACGSKAEVNECGGMGYYCNCLRCDLTAPLADTPEKAVDIWNRITIAESINDAHVASVRNMLKDGYGYAKGTYAMIYTIEVTGGNK